MVTINKIVSEFEAELYHQLIKMINTKRFEPIDTFGLFNDVFYKNVRLDTLEKFVEFVNQLDNVDVRINAETKLDDVITVLKNDIYFTSEYSDYFVKFQHLETVEGFIFFMMEKLGIRDIQKDVIIATLATFLEVTTSECDDWQTMLIVLNYFAKESE